MNHAQNEGLSRRRILGGAVGLAAGAAPVAAGLPSGGASAASAQTAPDLASWRKQAAHVTIIRDDWGVAHVAGKTDADAVFGMIYG
ncbi:penicillin acylase family protein [Micromonospora sicca]|uniref:penicillin acylase family protein n=1 Tax=Micromonospora sicca TaxID=2202420 RepID=UPI00191C21BD|nr:penicillin acylase family protein [Micromonospora sp. 4G51]